MHGVVEEMDRRGKSESVAISSAIDMGESETVSRDSFFLPSRRVSAGSMASLETCDSSKLSFSSVQFLLPVHTEK